MTGQRAPRQRTPRQRTHRLALAALLLAGLAPAMLTPGPATADWRLETLLLQELFFDDNITLSDEDEEDSLASRSQPGLRLSKEAPNSLLALEAELTHNRFFSADDLNSTDQRGNLQANWQGARTGLGFEAELNRNTTRESELEDSGRIDRSVRRLSWLAAPSLSYLTGPLSRIEASASANRVTFGSDEFSDFTSFAGQLAYIQSLTPRDEIGLVFAASHFDSENTENSEAENYVLSASWSRTPNDRFETSIETGLRLSNSRFDENGERQEETSLGFNLQGSLDWQFDQGRLTASLLNAAEPSSDGALRQRTRAQSNLSYRLGPRLTAGFITTVELSEDIDAASDDDGQRIFFSASPSLTYQLAETWRLRGSYRFRGQDLEDEDLALSNAVFITLTYNSIPFAF